MKTASVFVAILLCGFVSGWLASRYVAAKEPAPNAAEVTVYTYAFQEPSKDAAMVSARSTFSGVSLTPEIYTPTVAFSGGTSVIVQVPVVTKKYFTHEHKPITLIKSITHTSAAGVGQ